MGASCTKAGREEAAFLKAAKDGDCRLVQQAILKDVEWACKVQTWNGQSVLHLAARYGRLDVLETVVEAVRFNPAGPDKWKKLLRMGHSTDAILRSFVNLPDARSQTPLHLACIYGHHEVAERLLQLGGSPWAWDELGGRTPLHYAASMGHVDVIRVIISHNAPAPTGEALRRPNSSRTRLVDICNDSGYTPLHYAVWAGNAASVRALTSYEASLSARNVACGSDWVVSCLKCTPLHLAAHKGNVAVVKLLLSAYVQYQPPQGTDAPPATDRRRRDPRRHVNANRQLPYHVAVSRNHNNLSEMLHPDVPFSFILTPAEMESRLYGVPKLAALAARTLQTKLIDDIESALAAMSMTSAAAAAPRGVGSLSSCGSMTAGRTRSGAMTALSGAVVAAATGQATAAAASVAAHQVLAAATARLRSVNERSLHGSTAAVQALESVGGQSSPSPPQPLQRPASADRLPNGATALTAPPAAAASLVGVTPVATAAGGVAAAAAAAANGAVGGKSASAAPSSDKSSGTSGGDSEERDALPVEPVPDLASRPTPPDDAGAGNAPPALPLPPAPISPFLPSASATAAGAAAGAASAGAGPSVARVPTFNEAASAFALFAAEPFDDPVGAAAAGAAAGGQALQSTGSTSVSIAVIARARAQQAAGGQALQPTGSNSISIAVLARSKLAGPGGNSGSKAQLAPRRSRSLRALLTGASKNRRSNTNTGGGGGPAAAGAAGGQQARSELPYMDDLAADDDVADDLDDILNAMQPPEDLEGVTAAAAAAAAAMVAAAEGGAAAAVAARGESASQVPPPTPSRGRGASGGGGGSRPFWRRSSTQVPPQSGQPTPDGGASPYTGSLHAGVAASAALAAAATPAASTAPPETLPPPPPAGGGAPGSRAPSLPMAVPPGVIESRASTEVADFNVNPSAMRRCAPPSAPAPPPVGVAPMDSIDGDNNDDDDSDPTAAPPSSAGTRVRRSSISLAALARGGAEALLPPPPVPDHEHVDGAVLAMLASLVEAPQHVLRRYRLLQLTHGLDLQDLLRDHSEQAAAAAAAVAAAGGGGGSQRISGVVPAQPPPQSLVSQSELSAALPVPPPALLVNASLRATATSVAGCPRGSGAVDAAVLDAAAAAVVAANASVGSVGGASVDASPTAPSGAVTSPLAQDAAALSTTGAGASPRLPTSTGLTAAGSPGGGGAAAAGIGANANAVSANLAGQLLRTLSSAAASESGEGTCGVCFDQPDTLSIVHCGHRLCTDCSRELCKLNTLKPALCPFCRGMIGGFKFVGRQAC